MVIYQKPHCVDSRDVDSRHRFNECQLDPTEGWLSVFFSGSGCSSGSPVIARPLVSDPGLPSGFTSNRPWAGRWTPKLLLTSGLAPVMVPSVYECVCERDELQSGRIPRSQYTVLLLWIHVFQHFCLPVLLCWSRDSPAHYICNYDHYSNVICRAVTSFIWEVSRITCNWKERDPS